ncbi:hypothetical protein Plhal304r1_c011g0044191 [Plasmopara halstedii]
MYVVPNRTNRVLTTTKYTSMVMLASTGNMCLHKQHKKYRAITTGHRKVSERMKNWTRMLGKYQLVRIRCYTSTSVDRIMLLGLTQSRTYPLFKLSIKCSTFGFSSKIEFENLCF